MTLTIPGSGISPLYCFISLFSQISRRI